ncbi:MAG: sensor domain-containing diguanylate cyclase [Desulfosarcinaceae bacterium]|nr:sensor domain-containing diguanylate cyclase [Desulfosarcinaceae bacterium]
MPDLQAIIERLRENDALTRKFNEIETRILSILNFKDLFEVLLTEIQEKFSIPYVWISLIEPSEISSLIKTLETSQPLRERISTISRENYEALVGTDTRPKLVNADLKPYFRLLPPKRKFFIKSLALIPLSLDGQVIGSLNQADFSQKRYQPGIDTSLLEILAVKVSLCLSNVTAHEKLKHLAYHDPTTGLLNRRVMETVLAREFARARRYDTPLSVAFIDLDDFKSINDRYGHDAGDETLRHVSERLLQMSRECDVVARYAGDEFVLILPQTGPQAGEQVIKRIRDYLCAQPIPWEEELITVRFSYGISSTVDSDLTDWQSVLKNADRALLAAKATKKNRH